MHLIVLSVKRMKYKLCIIIRYLCHGVDIIWKYLDIIQDFTDCCQMLNSNNSEESQLDNFYLELKYMLLHMVTDQNYYVSEKCYCE
jgi:hypothetical protein